MSALDCRAHPKPSQGWIGGRSVRQSRVVEDGNRVVLLVGDKHQIQLGVDIQPRWSLDPEAGCWRVNGLRFLLGRHDATDCVIVVGWLTGDFAADWWIVSAARDAMDPDVVFERIVTVVRDDSSGTAGFRVGAEQRARGRTSEARRISFVRDVDGLIAVGGRGGTNLVGAPGFIAVGRTHHCRKAFAEARRRFRMTT